MKEPWQTLLGQYADHPLLADFVDGDTPRVRALMKDEERWWSISSGERAMWLVADALLTVNEAYLAVDAANRLRIDHAILLAADR